MSNRRGELRMQRRLTAAFVHQSRQMVVLRRAERTPDGAGGFTEGTPVSLRPQRFALVIQVLEGTTANEHATTPEADAYALVGRHDADIRVGDRLTFDGREYWVTFIHPDRSYETRAEVGYLG